MIPQTLFTEIEGPRLAAQLGVVSTLDRFTTAMMQHPAVAMIVNAVTSQDDVRQIVARVERLLQVHADPRYCHPQDLAIAVYLRILDVCAPDAAAELAARAREIRNLWWARLIAHRIGASPNRSIPTVTVTRLMPVTGMPVRAIRTVSSTRPAAPRDIVLLSADGMMAADNANADEELTELIRVGARIQNYTNAVAP